HDPVDGCAGDDLAEAERDAEHGADGGGEGVDGDPVDLLEDALAEELDGAPDEERGDAELAPLGLVGIDAEDLGEEPDENNDQACEHVSLQGNAPTSAGAVVPVLVRVRL